jgi:hypothetical protein
MTNTYKLFRQWLVCLPSCKKGMIKGLLQEQLHAAGGFMVIDYPAFYPALAPRTLGHSTRDHVL